MGSDAHVESLVQLFPKYWDQQATAIGLLKNINKFMRFAYLTL
jgi:hypothetical protein